MRPHALGDARQISARVFCTYIPRSKIKQEEWRDVQFRKRFLHSVSKTLSIGNWEDWYKIDSRGLINVGARGLLDIFGSPAEMLKATYPEHDWKVYKFKKVPPDHWSDKRNQLAVLDDVAKTLELQRAEDWYQVTLEQFEAIAGSCFLPRYDDSLIKALQALYPDVGWKTWRFKQVPRKFWGKMENQKAFLDDVAKELDLRDWTEWYQVKKSHIENLGGSGLIARYYGGSYVKAIIAVYNDLPWDPIKFTQRDKDSDHRDILDLFAKTNGIKDFEDWYPVSPSLFDLRITNILRTRYNNSIVRMLCSTYPEKPWQVWKFLRTPNKHWEDMANVRELMTDAAGQLKIRELDDWHYVTYSQLESLGFAAVLRKFGSLRNLFEKVYPHHDWTTLGDTGAKSAAGPRRSKGQYLTFKALRSILPPSIEDVHMNYLHPTLRTKKGLRLELDIYVPSLNLALEYQGEYHFKSSYGIEKDPQVEARDDAKKLQCKSDGITLIQIPYWWDKTARSLMISIKEQRPDINFVRPE